MFPSFGVPHSNSPSGSLEGPSSSVCSPVVRRTSRKRRWRCARRTAVPLPKLLHSAGGPETVRTGRSVAARSASATPVLSPRFCRVQPSRFRNGRLGIRRDILRPTVFRRVWRRCPPRGRSRVAAGPSRAACPRADTTRRPDAGSSPRRADPPCPAAAGPRRRERLRQPRHTRRRGRSESKARSLVATPQAPSLSR